MLSCIGRALLQADTVYALLHRQSFVASRHCKVNVLNESILLRATAHIEYGDIMLVTYLCIYMRIPEGAITRPNFYMKLKRETAFHKLFTAHLMLHNHFGFEFSLQFMKFGLVV